jgi:hypothetical protein
MLLLLSALYSQPPKFGQQQKQGQPGGQQRKPSNAGNQNQRNTSAQSQMQGNQGFQGGMFGPLAAITSPSPLLGGYR